MRVRGKRLLSGMEPLKLDRRLSNEILAPQSHNALRYPHFGHGMIATVHARRLLGCTQLWPCPK